MGSELIVAVVMKPFDRRVLDGAVHPFDLAVGPWMVGLGQSMLDAVGLADHVEAHWPGVDGVPVPRLLCELDAVIRQNRVDLIGHGLEHVLQELPGCLSVSSCNELSNDELRGPVDADEQVELALGGLHLGNVDMEEADGIAFELLSLGLVPFDIWQARDAVPLQAPMQRRPGQVRDRGLKGIEAVIQWQKSMAPERDDRRFLVLGQDRRARFLRSGLHILDRCPLPPLRHRLRINPQLPAQLRERSLRSLYCCSDGVRGRGAPVTNLSHSASFHSQERIAPSNHGIKHLGACFAAKNRHVPQERIVGWEGSHVIGGVDTQNELDTAAVVDHHDRVLGTETFPATRRGYRLMLTWMRSLGDLQRVGVECSGSYGAG